MGLRRSFLFIIGIAFYSYEYILRILPSAMVDGIPEFSNISDSYISQFSFYYYLGYTLMQLPVGLLLDCMSQKKLMVIACLLCALGNALFLQLDYPMVVNFGRFLIGIGSSFAFIGVLQMANHNFHKKNFPLATGLIVSVVMFAGLVGEQLLVYFFNTIGFCLTLHGLTFFAIGLSLLFYYMMPNTPVNRVKNTKKLFDDVKLLIKNKKILLNGICGGLFYLPLPIFAELFGIRFFYHHNHLSLQQATNMNTFLFLGWAVGAPLMGWFAARSSLDKILMRASFFSMVLAVIIIFSHLTNLWLISILMFLFGVFAAGEILVIPKARDLCPPGYQATGMGLTSSIVMFIASLSIFLVKQLSLANGSPGYANTDWLQLAIVPLGIGCALVMMKWNARS